MFKKSHFRQRKKLIPKYLMLLCVPIIIICVFVCVLNAFYSSHQRQATISTCTNQLNIFLQSTENKISSMTNVFSSLMTIPEIKNITEIGITQNDINKTSVNSMQSSLLSYSTQTLVLDNIIIINRSGDFVLSNTGLYDIDYFFEHIYSYDAYPAGYWRDYKSGIVTSTPLPATNARYSVSSKDHPVVPYIFQVGGAQDSTMIVFNINIYDVFDDFCSYKFTDNSALFMVNTQANSFVTEDNSLNVDAISKKLSQNKHYYIGDMKIDNDDYYIITSQKRFNSFGYTYGVCIPHSDIKNYFYDTTNSILILASLLMLIMIIYAYFGSIVLSKPWIKIAKIVSKNTDESINSKHTFDYVHTSINSIMTENTEFARKLSVTLPYSKQKYLTEILNNPSLTPIEDMNELMFEYEYFMAVAVSISLKAEYYTSPLGIVSPTQLINDVYKTVECVFASKFLTFAIMGTNNVLYLILNIKDENITDDINYVNKQLQSLFAADVEYINIYTGNGNIYKGIDGIHLSHKESAENIFKEMNKSELKDFDNKLSSLSFSVYNENILINNVISGNKDFAIEFIKNIFTTCSKSSTETKSHIYADIFQALYKVVNLKNIHIPDFKAKSNYEIIAELLKQPDDVILNYFTELITNITNIGSNSNKATSKEIIDYIHQNYDKDLYLDKLAEEFNITPKYLSKMLKKHLGIPFKTYLTQLRISRAEQFLVETNEKINDIGKMVGFLNNSSFIRAFKQKNGISPSEYRSLYKK